MTLKGFDNLVLKGEKGALVIRPDLDSKTWKLFKVVVPLAPLTINLNVSLMLWKPKWTDVTALTTSWNVLVSAVVLS